ncbi:DNA polymerase III subunit alpha, partial [Butyricicoccus sp. 1XD8-22]
IEGEPIRLRWFEAARRLEGLPRNASTHAAGVILSPVPLVEVVPIEKGHDDIYLTQWPMQEVEQLGLLKMDFLGLRNLTVIEQIRKGILYSTNIDLDLNQIPLNDEKTYQLLQNGDTAGIFQLESEGMQNALREIKPTQILDIVAVNALYRPGPMEFISNYAKRKAGKETVYMPHQALEPILKETYGIIVYQEQIMQIANVMAGFTLGQADLLRRAVSKKNREILEEQ